MRKIIVITALCLVSLSTTMGWAVDSPIPDTGQTKCYNDSVEITCPSPGEPFYGQDAQYTTNTHSYTQLNARGHVMDLSDDYSMRPWTMVRDNVTGLIWEVKDSKDDTPDYNNPHDADNTYTWYDGSNVWAPGGDGTDTEDFINALNTAKFGGYNDWRMPTIKEISSIVNSGIYDPAIDTDYFPNTAPNLYWSSTPDYYNPGQRAWFVSFFDGYVSQGGFTMRDFSYVRAVRGGHPEPGDRFIDNGDETVTDTSTGLMWKQTDTTPERYSWEEALHYCDTLSHAGYYDWRLPDRNELQSIVDYSQVNSAIDETFFPNLHGSDYWSSTTITGENSFAWHLYLAKGEVGSYRVKSVGIHVMAVRGTTIAASTTTTTTSASSCPIEEIYGNDSEETQLLRSIRDNVLSKSQEGRELIKLYYQWSPAIVRAMEQDAEFKADVKATVDKILWMVK